MNDAVRTHSSRKSPDKLRASAFDLSPEPALIIDGQGGLAAANEAAEALFGQGLSLLTRGRFRDAMPTGSALVSLLDRAISEAVQVRERGVEISLFGNPPFPADCAATPLGDGSILISIHVRASVLPSDRIEHAGIRSIIGLGRMLAHEIKNPLMGIRGAAQLLGFTAKPDDAPLAQLIVDETDRVRRLVDRLESFSDDSAPLMQPVNIHAVLDRVRAISANGAADGIVLKEAYDPSLPSTLGDEDQLIQIFLNLVKNAAEAAHSRGDNNGAITITTRYRHGMRVRGADGRTSHSAPLEVRIQDNGPGVPPHLREDLFQPFVTSKAMGQGLGLALVAKLVAGHGGLIDFESEPGRTVFRVLLPIEQ